MTLTVTLTGLSRPLLATRIPPFATPSFLADLIRDAARRVGVSVLALSYSVEA